MFSVRVLKINNKYFFINKIINVYIDDYIYAAERVPSHHQAYRKYHEGINRFKTKHQYAYRIWCGEFVR